MKTLFAALAFTLTLALASPAQACMPPRQEKIVFELSVSHAFGPQHWRVQLLANGNVRVRETNPETGEQSEKTLARLDERATREALAAVALVKPEMKLRELTAQEKRRQEGCAMDSAVSHSVLGERFPGGRKVVIRELGCGLSVGLADAEAAQAMEKLAGILDKAWNGVSRTFD